MDIICAIDNNDIDVVEQYLDSGININEPITLPHNHIFNMQNNTLLHLTTKFDRIEIATLLIERGADINIGHYPPLATAARNGSNKVAKLLIDRGANKYSIDSALNEASQHMNLELVQILLDAGAYPNWSTNSCLFRVSTYNSVDIAELLIEYGADVNIRGFKNQTPLFEASRYGSEAIASVLIKHGADVNAKDEDQRTSLHVLSCYSGPVLKLLIDHGAHINSVDKYKYTPLMNIIENLCKNPSGDETLKVLLEYQDLDVSQSIEMARHYNRSDLVQLLQTFIPMIKEPQTL